jgi:uncharacterized low-complexity protein
MSKRKTLSLALGAAVVGTIGLSGAVNATEMDEDIFAMDELNSGYLIAGGHLEGGCGEDREGGDDAGDDEGSCGEDKKDGEGKCGEGKCGSS